MVPSPLSGGRFLGIDWKQWYKKRRKLSKPKPTRFTPLFCCWYLQHRPSYVYFVVGTCSFARPMLQSSCWLLYFFVGTCSFARPMFILLLVLAASPVLCCNLRVRSFILLLVLVASPVLCLVCCWYLLLCPSYVYFVVGTCSFARPMLQSSCSLLYFVVGTCSFARPMFILLLVFVASPVLCCNHRVHYFLLLLVLVASPVLCLFCCWYL